MISNLTSIFFQDGLGWFNHQLVNFIRRKNNVSTSRCLFLSILPIQPCMIMQRLPDKIDQVQRRNTRKILMHEETTTWNGCTTDKKLWSSRQNQWLIRMILIHDWMTLLLLDLYPGGLMFAGCFLETCLHVDLMSRIYTFCVSQKHLCKCINLDTGNHGSISVLVGGILSGVDPLDKNYLDDWMTRCIVRCRHEASAKLHLHKWWTHEWHGRINSPQTKRTTEWQIFGRNTSYQWTSFVGISGGHSQFVYMYLSWHSFWGFPSFIIPVYSPFKIGYGSSNGAH